MIKMLRFFNWRQTAIYFTILLAVGGGMYLFLHEERRATALQTTQATEQFVGRARTASYENLAAAVAETTNNFTSAPPDRLLSRRPSIDVRPSLPHSGEGDPLTWMANLPSAKQQAVVEALAENANWLRGRLGQEAPQSESPELIGSVFEESQTHLFARLSEILDNKQYREFVSSLPPDLQPLALKMAK
jgi:hypothetical protein